MSVVWCDMLYGVGDPFICTYVHGVVRLLKSLLMEESFQCIQHFLIKSQWFSMNIFKNRPLTVKYV